MHACIRVHVHVHAHVLACTRTTTGRRLVRAHITRWGSDEFAGGSYSVVPVGASSQVWVGLAA